ncbi:RagB/SusD family nutrient uptake outer membrane protein [Echinicola rosea]|uniref:Glycan metabolism protein RagB n=1 Tax=Echinicola rosea TaxID=1807691 RepID=A0ABQ1V9U7_9BACT|nr:RagB/SusD family nutrient uptake outer membrane protein [Echinicola rosea]GGF44322.1 glycan metabolism protein RagB [Echinicola rosea]
MKYKLKPILTIMIISIIHLLTSCEEFLDEKPEKSIVVPESLEDLQKLLDASRRGMNDGPGLGLLSGDELLTNDNGFGSYSTVEQNTYLWKQSIFENYGFEWTVFYQQVFYANVVLDGLKALPREDDPEGHDQVRGRALFYRANAFYNLLSLFSPAYVPGQNDGALGIPLRLGPDINLDASRASLADSYEKVIEDLKESVTLLPQMPDFKSRPSQWAAHALLSRVYLSLGDYPNALDHAEAALSIEDDLLDFNDLDLEATYPFEQFNNEVIFHSEMISHGFIRNSNTVVSPEIYGSYEENDLRKQAFFQENSFGMDFKGTYTGTVTYFCGLATDELFLNKSECLARIGDSDGAKETMDRLLEHRFVSGTFEGTTGEGDVLLVNILTERKKELLCRGTRWADLKRLNKAPEFAKTLERTVDGQSYQLEPGSKRYVLPIPPDEINVSGIVQNER